MAGVNTIKKIVRGVATVASNVAKKQNPIYTAKILSRSPDGSLNVDDGSGGCVRQIPPANYRVGDTLVVGTEPAIGTTTNLDQLNFSISPFGAGCPAIKLPFTDSAASIPTGTPRGSALFGYLSAWADRNVNQGPGGGTLVPQTTASDVGTNVVSCGADYYLEPLFGVLHFYHCVRGFLQFDTNGLLPPGASLTSLALRGIPFGDSFHDIKAYIVQGTFSDLTSGHPEVPPSEVGSGLITGNVLASFRILDAPFGSSWDIPLDMAYWNSSGFTKLALITEYDFLGVPPPDLDSYPYPFSDDFGLACNAVIGAPGVLNLGTQPPVLVYSYRTVTGPSL